MKRFTNFLVAGVLAIGLMTMNMPASADETRTGWETFIEESYGRFSEFDPTDWEDVLYAAAKAKKNETKAIEEFGRRIGVDTATARLYADVIVEAVAFREATADYRAPKVIQFAPGQKLHDLTAEVAMKEPTGRLLFVVGKVVDTDPTAFIRLAKAHPAAVAVFLELADYGVKGPYLIAALKDLPSDPSKLTPLILQQRWYNNTLDTESLRLAAIEVTYQRLPRAPETRAWRAALSRYMILSLLVMGEDAEALALYRGNAEELLPFWLEASDDNVSEHKTFAQSVAAALSRQGDASGGIALLDRLSDRETDNDLIHDAFTPTIPDAQLFDLYVVGPPCDKNDEQCIRRRTSGLGFAFDATPAIKALLAARLVQAGYHDIARDVAIPHTPRFGERVVGYDGIDDLVPEGALARATVWKARIAAWQNSSATASDTVGPVAVTVTKLPAIWTENPLPKDMALWGDNDPVTDVPEDAKLPRAFGSIVRHEGLAQQDTDGGAAILFESARYDLPGEIPAYGLWLSLRHDNAWSPELYLGLQQHFPYVATPGSRLPLVNRDDPANPRLQIEVRIEEIDKDTITFPPVGLSFAREAGGLYLDAPLAAVMQDSDEDGLSDIEEARLGMKPDQKDSDGDGVDDSFDPMPLTAYRRAADESTTIVARTVLERIMGHDSGAIMVAPRSRSGNRTELNDDLISVLGGGGISQRSQGTYFLVADPAMFVGIAKVPGQFIVYSEADLKALGRDKGVFYPPRLTTVYRSLDGKRWFIEWSAGWVGGSFMIDCTKKVCKTDELSNWIT